MNKFRFSCQAESEPESLWAAVVHLTQSSLSVRNYHMALTPKCSFSSKNPCPQRQWGTMPDQEEISCALWFSFFLSVFNLFLNSLVTWRKGLGDFCAEHALLLLMYSVYTALNTKRKKTHKTLMWVTVNFFSKNVHWNILGGWGDGSAVRVLVALTEQLVSGLNTDGFLS